MNLSHLLVLVSATLNFSDAFKHVTSENEEAVYSWRAEVKAGTHTPASYASQLTLEGKIHLRAKNNSTFVKITDLNYGIHYGIADHRQRSSEVPVPPDVEELENVFKIVYDDDGLVNGVVSEVEEKEYSRNIKKAIATIFQMNATVLGKEYHRPEALVTRENSIYGHGFVDYTIFPRGDGIEIHKLHDMPHTKDMFSYYLTNIEPVPCTGEPEEMVMHDSKKIYYVTKQNGHHVIKDIVATGSVVYYPYEAKSIAHIVVVNQTFHLEEVVPTPNEYHIKSEHFDSSLAYTPFVETQDGSIFDVTNGRSTTDFTRHISFLRDLLKDVRKYLDEDHLEAKQRDNQLINRIQRLLLHCNVESLQELQKSLSDDALRSFYHILPLVRTDASTLFIKNLIVGKVVSEDIAIEMLHHFAENTRPWGDLLPKLEELIHLDETYSWEVRTNAILAFGSLIHKSYVFTKRHSPHATEDDLEKPYAKYVSEYIARLRSTDDYETQFVYIFGLRNMKLPVLIKELIPAYSGEWFHDPILRFMSLWSAVPSIQFSSDLDTVIETVWPLFTDREELPEMRIIAYYAIMMTKPNDSRLKNILSTMLTESNDEVYHFHYTYLQSMIKSKNPCNKEMGVKLRQLIKFSPPPRRGLASINLYSYVDTHYGFSTEVENYFVKTNHSRMYASVLNTQQHNLVTPEEYMYFVVVEDGKDDHDSVGNVLGDILTAIRKTNNKNRKLRIEGGYVRRGQVLNTIHFDDSNLQELSFLDVFKEESKVFKTDFLHVNYDRYQRGLITTDLGIPVIWEYLMPEVSSNNLSLTKTVSDKGLEFQFDNRYVNWIHYRHGLSFYNPFGDVWQGITRYQAYDFVLPVHLHAVVDIKKGTFDLSWSKQSELQDDVTGLRAYAQQVVFVRDDHRHTFQESAVAYGNKDKHDYPLINVNNPNFGYKWYATVFTSDVYAAWGRFQHQVYLYAQTANKYFEVPTEYLFLTIDNARRYFVYIPTSGSFVWIVKGEPTAISIDLSGSFAREVKDENNLKPGTTWFLNMTYAVKDKDGGVRSWDLKTSTGTKPGHRVEFWNAELTRHVPGEKQYKVCYVSNKVRRRDDIIGSVNITMGESATINVTIAGRRSLAQIEGHRKYESCQYVIPFSWPRYHTMDCLVAHSTVRHYTYDVKTTNLPKQLKTTIGLWWDHAKGWYQSYSWYYDEHTDDDTFKIEAEYPLETHQINVNVTTPEYKFELSGVPIHDLKRYGLTPESLVYPEDFLDDYRNDRVDRCTISPGHVHFNTDFISTVVPEEWAMFANVSGGDTSISIYVKQVAKDKIALKVLIDEHSFELVPHSTGGYEISQDGELVPLKEQNHEGWIYYHVFAEDVGKPVAGFIPEGLVHFEYDVQHVTIVIPKSNV